MTEQAVLAPRKNYICNFRAPNLEKFQEWKVYVQWAQEHGYDVCHLTISLTEAFMKGTTATLKLPNQTFQIQMSNTFNYQVMKSRREPFSMMCVKSEFVRTISSVLFESYVLEKARRMTTEFSYRDFLELKHDAFRRIIVRLKRKGRIMTNPLKTKPQFYFLTERLEASIRD